MAYITNFKKLEIKSRIAGVHKITDLTYRREIYKALLESADSTSLGSLLYLKLKSIYKTKFKEK